MLRKIQLMLGVCLGLTLLQGAHTPPAQAFGEGSPFTVHHCFHVISGVPESTFYAIVWGDDPCPPVPDSAEGHKTPTEHDCYVDRNGGEV